MYFKHTTVLHFLHTYNTFNSIILNSLDFKTFFLLKKSKKAIKSLSLYILTEDAKLKSIWAPTLTPLIGKDKINEFCLIFNKESAPFYATDVYVPVFFLLYKNKTYIFIFRIISLFVILKYLYDVDHVFRDPANIKIFYYLTLEEIFLILHIKYTSVLFLNELSCLSNFLKIFIKFRIFLLS
jgi:ribosomal protein L11